MRPITRNKNFILILLLDGILIIAAYILSYLLRFEGVLQSREIRNILLTLPFILPCKLLVFYIFGVYKGIWRYTGLLDIINILKSSTLSSILIITGILFMYRFEGFSRSVFIFDAFLTFFLVSGIRTAVRISHRGRNIDLLALIKVFLLTSRSQGNKKRLLIIGAGDAAEKMLREINDNPRINYKVVGFLDDDVNKAGKRIHGVPVLGKIDIAPALAAKKMIDEILIAIPSASTHQMKRIIHICEATGIKYRTTPGIGELINGRISFRMMRHVSFEDLLGREQVRIDIPGIDRYINNKVILVTGAGGSIGSELSRQIALFRPANLILLDKTENNLFHIEMELRQRHPNLNMTPVLGDVCQKNLIRKLFQDHKPKIVFHAAAFKHVPIVELNPAQGVINNILGTLNMAEESYANDVERFILISTDKAVRPVSIMGATKRVAELIISGYANLAYLSMSKGAYLAVRFGNVIGSEGSVANLFKKQIEQLGPVTVTHPEMKRFFMTVQETVKLILQAGAIGKGGEIFILDMGVPIKILDMAKELIQLSGFRAEEDIDIKFIGLRPGEKLSEELIAEDEEVVKSEHEKILILKGKNEVDIRYLKEKIEAIVRAADAQNEEEIKLRLKEIVPEYTPYAR